VDNVEASLLNVTIISTITGILGTGIGGASALSVKNSENRLIAFLMHLSAGMMTGIVMFDLMPAALDTAKKSSENFHLLIAMAGLSLGIAFAFILDALFSFCNEEKSKTISKKRLYSIGIITAVGISAHDLFEGIAIGSGFEVSEKLGISMAIVILLHNIPEGLAMAAPLMAGGMKGYRAVILSCMTGIPMAVGAVIGWLAGSISPAIISICLAAAGGTMLYISFCDMIPAANSMYTGKTANIGVILGVILGIVIINLMGQ